MVAIEQRYVIFSKVTSNLHQKLYSPQQYPVTKSATVPHKVGPMRTKPIPLERPNIIEDDDGNSRTDFQRNFHMSPSCPHIILPDVPVQPPNVRDAQPPRMDTGSPRFNLRSSCRKNPAPNFALAAQFLQVREANTVTHQIYIVAQEYRHLF